ncbi:MAG: hypothetical protein KGL44_13600 [Sphingomonadales bacterium]|nr:hypothetical protein [Sphingomonadales bacterium]
MTALRLAPRAAILALTALLAACGGSVASTPAPTITPAPPPPATPVNASLTAPLKSETFNALTARATGTETPTSIRNATASLQGTASTISYDAATNTYVFSNPAASASGAGPDRVAIVAAGPDCYATACTVSGTAIGSFMRRGGDVTNANGFLYTYVAYANWHSEAAAGSDHNMTMNMAVFGATTPASGVPVSGTASYKLDLRGNQMTGPLGTSAGRAILPSFGGNGTASVDFAAATYTMTGDMGGVLSQAATTFSSSGKLSAGANGFAGNFSFADSGAFTGALQGWFFGPAAQELGAVFAATAPDGRSAVGTIVGHQ